MTTQTLQPATSSRTAGLVGFWVGLLGVAAGLLLAFYPAAVDEDRYSYPFTASGFAVMQVVLMVRDLGLVVLLLALWTSGATGRSRSP